MTLDLSDLDGFTTVVVTSADVTGRPVGKRLSVDVFRRVVHEGTPLSSCVLGWDLDQWPGPVQEYTGHHTGWHDVRLVPDLGTLLLYTPTVNSYRRTMRRVLGQQPVVGLRQPDGLVSRAHRIPESTRLEWRVPGADVDPYLAIAALIASARDGIETDAEPGEPLVGRDYDRPVRPPPEAIERFRDGGSHLRPSVRTWWRISRRRADGSGSSSCPLARSASGSEGATSTSSEEVVE